MQDIEKHFGYVYKITNEINGKTYVGKHRIKPNEDWLEYMGSGKLITLAIAKYGKENFTKEFVSYAETDEELSEIELKFIQLEKAKNKSEYNLMMGDTGKINWSSISDLTNYPILDWYFNDKLSTREIANRIGCSQSTVIKYFDEFRDTDTRFKDVKQRVNRNPSKKSVETIEKTRNTLNNLERIECAICEVDFHPIVINQHVKACEKRSIEPNRCPVCNVEILAKSKACANHWKRSVSNIPRNGYRKIYDPVTGVEARTAASISAAHTRWHVKRDIINPDCSLCVVDLPEAA